MLTKLAYKNGRALESGGALDLLLLLSESSAESSLPGVHALALYLHREVRTSEVVHSDTAVCACKASFL